MERFLFGKTRGKRVDGPQKKYGFRLWCVWDSGNWGVSKEASHRSRTKDYIKETHVRAVAQWFDIQANTNRSLLAGPSPCILAHA